MVPQAPTFETLGLSSAVLGALSKHGITIPTPIQAQSIPAGMKGGDLIGIAQTGTGKTFAFGLPAIEHLRTNPRGRVLVLLPTRELALQVDEALRPVTRALGIKTAVLIGGEGMGNQMAAIRAGARIVMATPGRLIDHLERKSVKLGDISILVLDEADRMLDMGFAPQLKKILVHLPTERQTLLFSATMPPQIVQLAGAFLKTPTRVEVAPQGTTARDVTQEMFIVSRDGKVDLLKKLLHEEKGTTLVFSRTKHGAKKIARLLNQAGLASVEIHGNRTLGQRKEALAGFKNGRYRILVATDIAARGIDVTGIALVINFDLPEQAEDYVHRIGRTGRAGMSGRAISFATPDQRGHLRSIERLIKTELPTTKLAEFDTFAPKPIQRGRGFHTNSRPKGSGYAAGGQRGRNLGNGGGNFRANSNTNRRFRPSQGGHSRGLHPNSGERKSPPRV